MRSAMRLQDDWIHYYTRYRVIGLRVNDMMYAAMVTGDGQEEKYIYDRSGKLRTCIL